MPTRMLSGQDTSLTSTRTVQRNGSHRSRSFILYDDVRELIFDWGYTAHIKSRGQEREACRKLPGYRARRWVVERTHSWMNRFRRLLIRWEKKAKNYLAFLHLACAYITLRAAKVLG